MKQRNPEANCGNCPYWTVPDSNSNAAQCERFPPFKLEEQPTFVPIHGNTMRGDVCGEHPDFFLPETPAPMWTYSDVSVSAEATPQYVPWPSITTPAEQAVLDAALAYGSAMKNRYATHEGRAVIAAVDTLLRERGLLKETD